MCNAHVPYYVPPQGSDISKLETLTIGELVCHWASYVCGVTGMHSTWIIQNGHIQSHKGSHTR